MRLRVVSFESRKSREMAALIEQSGGQALVAPALQEAPLRENHEALAFGKKILAGEFYAVVFTTGVGVRVLFDVLETRFPRETLLTAFSKTLIIARGAKPLDALRERGLQTMIVVCEPATGHQVLILLDEKGSIHGKTIAVQEYGSSNKELVDGLAERGARVVRVPVYRWTLPEDTEPLRHALHAVIGGQADVVLFTNSNQIQQVLRFAQEEGLEKEFRESLSKMVVASVGPVCTEFLDEYGVPVDLEPELPTMSDLVNRARERAGHLGTEKAKHYIVRSHRYDVRAPLAGFAVYESLSPRADAVHAGLADAPSGALYEGIPRYPRPP